MSDERRRSVTETKTFQEWSSMGYKILKGSKSVGRNASGVCLFSAEQVHKAFQPDMGEFDEDEFDPDLPGNPADYGDS